MATSAITFELSQDDYEGIVDMAGYGIGYWAMAGAIDNTGEDGAYKSYLVIDSDDDETSYSLTREKVEQAALDLFVKAPLNDYYMSAIRRLVAEGDSSDVGSDIADAIIQMACFGEVIYG
tara:strand:+ start:1472 stop:1831 length:360 start_codon:yes stop_codon:yes gene_type:complete